MFHYASLLAPSPQPLFSSPFCNLKSILYGRRIAAQLNESSLTSQTQSETESAPSNLNHNQDRQDLKEINPVESSSIPLTASSPSVDRKIKKVVQKTAGTFAPRASTARKNPAVPGTALYSLFEWQGYLSMVVGGALSYNLVFPSNEPDIWRLMGMWSIWMFTIPSLRARDCSNEEKEALNYLFLLIPLINVIIPFFWKSFAVVWSADTLAFFVMYAWKIKSKGVTMTALLAKASAMALAQHPVVNASCKDGKSFTYNSSVNIAVAVAMDGGLITPVLQDADKMDIYLISQKWKELVDKARSKQLQPQEYNSGTFTLSNLGMFGVDRFDAILPPGQGSIMAVGASKPMVSATGDGLLGVKSKMQVNVTADHRIIYGADLAAFLQTFAKIIENPEGLTL